MIQLSAFLGIPVKQDISYITAETEAKYQADAEYTNDTPYLALTGELCSVFCEYFFIRLALL